MIISMPEPTSTERPDVASSAAVQCLELLWRDGVDVTVDSREAATRMKRGLKETILLDRRGCFWGYKLECE